MINKSKIKNKQILFQDKVWGIDKVISPNKFQDFLLLSRDDIGLFESDGKTLVKEMALVDCRGTDAFIVTPQLIREIEKCDKRLKSKNIDNVIEE